MTRRTSPGTVPVRTSPASWPDVEQLFGTRGEPSRCWCRWFAMPPGEWGETPPPDRKEQLRARFDDGPAPAVLAYRNGSPVGWCAVEPRECYPRIERSKILRAAGPAALEARDVWSVSCFVVAPGHRRSGVASALLRAAVGHAFSYGAAVVEGYPVDPEQRPKAGPAELYRGTVALFEATGFEAVSRAVPGRAVMQLRRGHGSLG